MDAQDQSEEKSKLLNNCITAWRQKETCKSLALTKSQEKIDPSIQTKLAQYIRSRNNACFRGLNQPDTVESFFSNQDADNPDLILDIIGDADHSLVSGRILKDGVKCLTQVCKSTWILAGSESKLDVVMKEGIEEISGHYNKVTCDEINVTMKYFGFQDGNQLRNEVFSACGKLKGNMVVGGDKQTLEKLVNVLELNIPVVLMEGSGGLVDFIVPIIEQIRSSKEKDEARWIRFMKNHGNQGQSDEEILVSSILDSIPNDLDHDFNHVLLRKCLLGNELITISYVSQFNASVVLEGFLDATVEKRRKMGHQTRDSQMQMISLCVEMGCSNAFEKIFNTIELDNETSKTIFFDALMNSFQDSNTSFVKILNKYCPTVRWLKSKEINDWHVKSLFESDPVVLKKVRNFVEQEQVNFRGLHLIANMIAKILDKKCQCDSSNRCGEPITCFHIFVWALFYEHYQLAKSLWNLGDHPISNGVAAASILRSLKTPKYKEEGKFEEDKGNEEKEEHAKWYEDNAINLLMECDGRDPIRTKFLLVQNLKIRDISCLQQAVMDEDNGKFLSNSVCERHLDDIWMTGSNNNWATNIMFSLLSILLYGFIFSVVISIMLGQYFYVWTGLVFTVIASVVICFLQTGTIFSKHIKKNYDEIRPLEDEVEEDQNCLKGLSPDEMMALFKVGIDLSQLFPDVQLYSNWWELWSYRHPLWVFLSIPFHKFVAHFWFYVYYLVIFAVYISSFDSEFSGKYPNARGWMILVYWIAYFVVEISQIYLVKTRYTWKDGKLRKTHFKSVWNKLDIILLGYCIILMAIRATYFQQCHAAFKNENNSTTYEDLNSCHETSLVLNSFFVLYFFIWCVRLLQFFAVSRNLGPKLMMMKLMFKDLLRFIIIIILSSVVFGLSINWLMKTTEPDFYIDAEEDFKTTVDETMTKTQIIKYLDNVFGDPIWNLFGDGMREENVTACQTTENCQFYYDFIKKFLVPLLRFIYMFISGVLMLNLLIAVFNDICADVTRRATDICNVQRKNLLLEFYDRLPFPIPVSLIAYFIHFIMTHISSQNARFLPFLIEPLNIKIQELVNPNGTITKENGTDQDLNQVENMDNERKPSMKEWFDLITEWEKAIHLKLEKDKSKEDRKI